MFEDLFKIIMHILKVVIVFFIAFYLFLSLFRGMLVYAAEPPTITEGTYNVSVDYQTAVDASGYCHDISYSFVSNLPIYAYINNQDNGNFYLHFVAISIDGNFSGSYSSKDNFRDYKDITYHTNSKGEKSVTRTITSFPNIVPNAILFKPGDTYHVSCPLFNSRESLENFIATGDTSGRIKGEDVSYDYQHDFSNDTYIEDMEFPILSKVDHTGFVVDNSSDDLFLDVIMESYLCGVQHVKQPDTVFDRNRYMCLIAPYTYKRHYYNFADSTDLAINKSVINIKSVYGVDNASLLIKDFKDWSIEYPDHTKLPDYDKKKHGGLSASGMVITSYSSHVYDSSSSASDYQQLLYSGQAYTSFYVRFYDKDMNYSRWVKYTYHNSGLEDMSKEEVAVSPIDQGDGFTTWPVKVIGTPDDSGDIVYEPYVPEKVKVNIDFSDLDASDLWNTVSSIVSGMGVFPAIVSQVFSFMPSWVINLIGVGIAAIVILRFIGR